MAEYSTPIQIRHPFPFAKIVSFLAVVGIGLIHYSCQPGGSGGPAKTQPGMSQAHLQSAFAIIDPTYHAEQLVPEPDVRAGAPWLYGPVELESWKHQQMQVSSKAVAHNGHYPGAYHVPYNKVAFRFVLGNDHLLPRQVIVRSNAALTVYLAGEEIYSGGLMVSGHRIKIPSHLNNKRELLIKASSEAEPPGLLVEDQPFSTSNGTWEWSAEGTGWLPAVAFAQTWSGVLPHQTVMPEVLLKPVGMEGQLLDFGRQMIGYVTFRCQGSPSIIVGESMTEALDTVVSNHEQILTLRQTGRDEWISLHPLAFRHVQVLGATPTDLSCRAQFWPAQYKGAFACSDSLLTRIWMSSAYTHRLNKYEFMLDGIKRDRLPWVDNMMISSQVEAMTFHDPEIIRRTLAVLGRASDRSSINNIIDYDCLWLISQDAYQLHFNDPVFLREEWPRIEAMIDRIAATCDLAGLRRWPSGAWIFIDWVPGWDKNMAEQVMWWWGLKSGIRLAERMNDQVAAARWTGMQETLESTLRRKAWDPVAGAWTDPVKQIPPTRHGNLLSMVSGLTQPDQEEGVMRILTDTISEPINSPSMITYWIRALSMTGKQKEALQTLRTIWGAMLDAGTTTFWEGYDPDERGDQIYRFYDRPYGKSMCHAWGAGPVFLLPELIFGIRPLADGWARVAFDPNPGLVEWASATIPTSHGLLEVILNGNSLSVKVPEGITILLKGKPITGPAEVSETL